MSETLDRKIRKARKPHQCDYCGQTIEKGEEYDWSKNIYDGTIFEWHCHSSCDRIASAIWDYVDPDDGMSDQDFQDGCREVCQRFVCPDCPNYNKEYEDCEKTETYCIDKLDTFLQTHELYRAERTILGEVWKCREKGT